MQLALQNGIIYIKPGAADEAIVKGLPDVKFDRKFSAWKAPATLEMLDRLQHIVTLPQALKAERQRLQTIQDNVDCERLNADPVPLFDYPVKAKLFTHQIKGANMCMYLFGWKGKGDDLMTSQNKGFGLLFEMG